MYKLLLNALYFKMDELVVVKDKRLMSLQELNGNATHLRQTCASVQFKGGKLL